MKNMPNFKIVAYIILGCTDSGRYVKFTPKYNTVGGIRIFLKVPSIFFWEESGGYVEFTPKYIIVGASEFVLRFQSYSFVNSGPHAKFQNRSIRPSGLY